jgi:hypothetical protein
MAAEPMQDDWETIGEESGTLVKFENPGDQFTGVYVGTRHIVPPESESADDEFDQQLFRANEDGTGAGDELYAFNGGYKVREALKPEHAGLLTRLTYVKDIQTGQPSPMKDIKIQVRRA